MATAGDVITLIKTMNSMDNEEVGTSSDAQTASYIIFLNRALKELAHIAYRTRVSDVLNITTSDYYTFKKDSTDITDLYSPLRIMNTSEKPILKRTAFDAPTGWWRESDSQEIHLKGLNGNHVLYYVGYPSTVTDSNSPLDFPEAGVMGLTFWVIGIAKESRNAFEESAAMYARAKERLKVTILANESARGRGSSGVNPSVADVDTYFKF